MEYKKYDVFYIDLKNDEDNNTKGRPVLLMDNDNVYNVFDIYKISTKNKNEKYCYPIIKWKEAGLNEPSYIKLGTLYTINKSELSKHKTGTLQDEDIIGMKEKLVEIALLKTSKEIRNFKTLNNTIQIPKEIIEQIKNNNDNIER